MSKNTITSSGLFDWRIYICFAVLLLFALGLLIYSSFNKVDCPEIKYYIHAEHYTPFEVIEFYDKSEGAFQWEWDFGDGQKDTRSRTFHKYEKAGEYLVTLTLNKICKHQKVITISSKAQQNGYLPTITCPNVVFLGEKVSFEAFRKDGISYEWSFGETSSTDAIGEKVSYTFKKVGKKNITLIVNGDLEHIATKTIYVSPKHITAQEPSDIETYEFEKSHEEFSFPKGKLQKDPLVDMLNHLPVAPKTNNQNDSLAPSKKVTDISNEKFTLLLNDVAKQSKTKDDFKEFLCENYQTPVIINEEKILPFEQFCKEISGKKIKITSLRLQKDANFCVQNIYIYYKYKKNFFWKKA